MALLQTIPAMPVQDAAAAVAFYRDRLGFEVLHHDGGFAVLARDEAVVHLWEAGDESWRERDSIDKPIRSGRRVVHRRHRELPDPRRRASTRSTRSCAPPTSSTRCRATASPTRTTARASSPRSTPTGTSSPSSSGSRREPERSKWLRATTPSRDGRLRLGRISYVNMAPVFHRLDADVEEVQGVPTDLNRQLLEGEIDLAPISSIEYARNADRLRLLPGLCVGSEGAVDSIQLVTRLPLQRVQTVAVTPESATSVVLTKVLLPEAEHVPLGVEADATLLIGDAALKSAFEDPTPHWDLGRLWLERTGLPMVFAVWAAREPVADGLAGVEAALVESVRRARAEPELLAFEASDRYGYPAGFLARYFEKLRYSFGPRERAGLYTFLEMARDVGELEHVPELRFVVAGARSSAR